jgi:hypothetical protein
MDALTIAERDPLRTSGKIWWKSPPRTTSLPPNGVIALAGSSSARISHKVLSSASSHIIRVDTFISSANIVPPLTLHI